jgi:quercetin dioxygenase-like cupin family protein
MAKNESPRVILMLQIKHISAGDYSSMFGSQGLGKPLVQSGKFAADFLSFDGYQETSLHTHPGDHILIIYAGCGTLIFDGEPFELMPGTCYFVPGSVPHKIKANCLGLSLYSISNDHRPVNSANRLDLTYSPA